MQIVLDVVHVIHVVTAVLMAWPFYALVATNQRARLGPPLGDRADTYMENIIKNRTVPCFVFQATALVTGLALILLSGAGLEALVTNPILGAKFLLLLLIGGLLSYIHLGLQPQIDALFAQAGNPVLADVVPRISALRLRRRQLASVCLFSVLTAVMLGVQAWTPFPAWLTAALLVAIGLFVWRAYKSQGTSPYGWV